MSKGEITSYIDVAQVVLYLFWFFFAGLIVYLLRENKREGYPLVGDAGGRFKIEGFPSVPKPKTFLLPHGGTKVRPGAETDKRPLAAAPIAKFPGAPLSPTGNPMLDGVGPAAWAERAETCDLTVDGKPRIVPLRAAPDFHLEARDPDPRGMVVKGADGLSAGKVADVWVDRSEALIRYFEVELNTPAATAGEAATKSRVLLPHNFARIDGRRREVKVNSILAKHFAQVPRLAAPDQVTRREEDRVCAYYGGGTLYATPQRAEPKI